MKLSDVNVGERCKVLAVNAGNMILKRKMLDMGITSGVIVLVKRVAPFGDSVCLELRGYELCLRVKELENIEVVKL